MRFKIVLKSVLFLFVFLPKISAISLLTDYKAHEAYQEKDYNKAKEILEEEQVHTPNDISLNYNLGNVYYKLNKFKQAKTNFQRSVDNCSELEKNLKEVSYFNWGNSCYKNCLHSLPDKWEEKKLEEEILDFAIGETKQSIEKYKNTLVLNKQNDRAELNLNRAEELLKKLEMKKMQQEQQQQQQEENDQQDPNKEKNKDKKEQQDQKQQKQDGADQNQQEREESENNEKQDSSNKKNESEQNKRQKQEVDDGSDKRDGDEKSGQDDKFKEEQATEKDQDIDEHDQDSSLNDDQQQKDPLEEKGKQAGEENQESEEKDETSSVQTQERGQDIKEKGFRVILDNLQADESKVQKKLILQKSQNKHQHLNSNQKPW